MFREILIDHPSFRLSQPHVVTDQTANEPDVCTDAAGSLWVAFTRRDLAGDTIDLIHYPGAERVQPPPLTCSQPGIVCQPTIAATADGVLVAWTEQRAAEWLLVTRRIVGDQLQPETILARSAEGFFHPRLLADHTGALWLVCERVEAQQPRLVLFVQRGGSWSAEQPLTPAGTAAYRPALAAALGGIWLSYDVYEDGHYSVYVRRLDRAEAPQAVTHNGYHNLQSAVGADAQGRLWVAWSSNQNDAYRDRWWLTKWVYLRCYDGQLWSDPVCPSPSTDVYNEDSFQGWELPELVADAAGRIWLFGQSSHTLYAQYYQGSRWSELFSIARRHWGSWKPRVRAALAADGTIYLAAMGLGGAQLQQLIPAADAAPTPICAAPREPLPVVVPSAPPAERPGVTTPAGATLNVFFGDLHAHSIYSDATNDVDEFYHRYRDGYGYDFACLTDHDYLDGIQLTRSELAMIWNHADRMSQPGRFIALYGYEWTSPAIAEHAGAGQAVGEGHRHVIYPDKSGPLVSYGEENTGARLLRRLQDVDALVIAHHTAWSGTNWDAYDPRLQRVIEMCSTHGRFEYSGNQPIGYRRDHTFPEHYVLDALARGYRLGFVGGSDSHGLKWHATELPDRKSHIAAGTRVGWKRDAFRTGMTAVLAPELTREAIYQAIYERRCYATSGVPIFLDFRVNGALMGSEISVQPQPQISARVRGTAALRSVEVIRDGQVFAGLDCQAGAAVPDITFALTDTIAIPGETHYYYLRILQEDGNMAWSSPIWVEYEELR